jgi:heterodisulfide reductase subunit C
MPEKKKPREVKVTVKSPAPEEAPADAPVNPYAIIAEDTFAAAPRRDPGLVERILSDPRMHDHRDGFQSCIQCGVCTSGCPAARFTEYVPREIARRALDGDETLLTDDSLWYCYYCYTCQSRCPRHNSVAVINQVIRGLQVESGHAHRHVEMFAEWCAAFYDKGMGGDPHLLFPAIGEAWGEKWVEYMEHLLEVRAELGLGDLYPPDEVVKEVQTIMEETGFKERLRQVCEGAGESGSDRASAHDDDRE